RGPCRGQPDPGGGGQVRLRRGPRAGRGHGPLLQPALLRRWRAQLQRCPADVAGSGRCLPHGGGGAPPGPHGAPGVGAGGEQPGQARPAGRGVAGRGDGVRVIDGFLDAREDALRSEFADFDAPDGETYRRVCIKEVPGLREAIERAVGPVDMLGMGYRLNYAGELPNTAIHSDLGWGTHAAVVYLCDGPGGTAFWRHKGTGDRKSTRLNSSHVKISYA